MIASLIYRVFYISVSRKSICKANWLQTKEDSISITVNESQVLAETITVITGKTITLNAPEEVTLTVETDLTAADIEVGGTLYIEKTNIRLTIAVF